MWTELIAKLVTIIVDFLEESLGVNVDMDEVAQKAKDRVKKNREDRLAARKAQQDKATEGLQ